MADYVQKKLNLAQKSVLAAEDFIDALNVLKELSDERSKLPQDFQDSDFVGTEIPHLTAGILGTLFDFVVPSLAANYLDTANGERNKQILLQIKK